MANTIKLKRGTSTPSTSDIASGEVAVDTSAQKLYINDSGTVKEIGGGGSSIGGNTGVDFNDSVKARWGTGNDLEIFHDGNNSILHAEDNPLYLKGDAVFIQTNNNEAAGYFYKNGAVELFYDNSKKLETTSTGILAQTSNASTTESNADTLIVRNTNNGASTYAGIRLEASSVASTDFYIVAKKHSSGNGTHLHIGQGTNERLKITESGSVLIPDNGKFVAGAGSDLQIYHDSSNGNSHINESGSGSLVIKATNTYINNSADEQMIAAIADGAVELYYDSSKKLETTTTGYKSGDNVKAGFGDDGDLQIYHDGSNSYLKDSGAGALRIQTNHLDIINAANNEQLAKFVEDGAVELYYNGSKQIETTDSGVRIPDSKRYEIGAGADMLLFHNGTNNYIRSDNGTLYIDSSGGEQMVTAVPNGAVELCYDNSKKLETHSGGITVSGNIDCTGNIKVDDGDELRLGTGNDLKIYHDGTDNIILSNGASCDLLTYVANGELAVKAVANGAVELYYNNSKKFETSADGVVFAEHAFFGDNDRLKFGTGVDLQLWHDGTESVIENRTGDLGIRAKQDENGIVIKPDGAVELYYNNSKKLDTNSGGVKIHGNLDVDDNNKLRVGTSSDLQIYHDGSNSFISEAGTGVLKISGSAGVYINKHDNTETCAAFLHDAGVELYYNNFKSFQTNTSGINLYGPQNGDCVIDMYSDEGDDNADLWRQRAGQGGVFYLQNFAPGSWDSFYSASANGGINLYYDNVKKLETYANGVIVTGTLSADQVGLGDNEKIILGVGDDLQIFHNGSDSIINQTTQNNLWIKHGSDAMAAFKADGAVELYYNNSKKLETTSSGVDVTGTLTTSVLTTDATVTFSSTSNNVNFTGASSHAVWIPASNAFRFNDNTKALFGTGNDLQIYHNGSASYIQSPSHTLYIQATTIDIGNGAANEAKAKFIDNGVVELYHDNSKKFETRGFGARIFGHLGINATPGNTPNGRASFIAIGDSDTGVAQNGDGQLELWANNQEIMNLDTGEITCYKHTNPGTTNTYNLGSASYRWANLYVNDMHFSNEGKSNSVDGTWGDWTLQEGDENIFMINNRTGKKYKMGLQEVS